MSGPEIPTRRKKIASKTQFVKRQGRDKGKDKDGPKEKVFP